MAETTNNRIKPIEGMRFIMMIIIILSHCEFLQNTKIGMFLLVIPLLAQGTARTPCPPTLQIV